MLAAMAADLDLVRRLVAADQGLAVVATTRQDGSVQASVVNAGVLDDPISSAHVVGFAARGSAVKLRLLRRAGRATVVFRAGWEWVAVEGPVRLIDPGDLPGGFPADRLPQLLRDVLHGGRRYARRLGRVRPGDGGRRSGRRAGRAGTHHLERLTSPVTASCRPSPGSTRAAARGAGR
ncbi:hypothetical protein BH18ACT2_BH18ACT2_10050 [soil metagenome]